VVASNLAATVFSNETLGPLMVTNSTAASSYVEARAHIFNLFACNLVVTPLLHFTNASAVEPFVSVLHFTGDVTLTASILTVAPQHSFFQLVTDTNFAVTSSSSLLAFATHVTSVVVGQLFSVDALSAALAGSAVLGSGLIIKALDIQVLNTISDGGSSGGTSMAFLHLAAYRMMTMGNQAIVSASFVRIRTLTLSLAAGSLVGKKQSFFDDPTQAIAFDGCATIPNDNSGVSGSPLSLWINATVVLINGLVIAPSMQICAENISVLAPGTLSANALGAGAEGGSGQGFSLPDTCASGAGHGGYGGISVGGSLLCSQGQSYDVDSTLNELNWPQMSVGSGGGGKTSGGSGGGLVFILARNTLRVDGLIDASGGSSSSTYAGGGGSGGTVVLRVSSLVGLSSGVISANGGNGAASSAGGVGGGGGAGGAVGVAWLGVPDRFAGYAGTFSVTGGIGTW
jgi:hypothetical protein